jgi:hypothetical protein
MAHDLIKFLYITDNYSPFSFLDKLIDRIDLYDEVAYQSIRSIQAYKDDKHPRRFSLRLEVASKVFSNQLEKFAEWRSDKPFPRIRVDNEMVIFIPAKISTEKLIVCELKNDAAAFGTVLKIKDESFTSMHKFVKFVRTEIKDSGISSVTKLTDRYLLAFDSREKAQEAKKKFKAKRIIVADAHLCLGTMPINDSDLSDAVTNNSIAIHLGDKKEDQLDETKKLRKEVQNLRLEVEEIKEELNLLKAKMENKKAEEGREVMAGDMPGEIKITKSFPPPTNNYMAFMPFQPTLSHGWSYMYAPEMAIPQKKSKLD